MIQAIRKLLATGNDAPTSAAVKEAAAEVGRALAAARDALDRLQRERRDVLVTGDDEEIRAHDEEIRDTETRVEALEARQKALRSRSKDLEATRRSRACRGTSGTWWMP